jgi:hypothetical protein
MVVESSAAIYQKYARLMVCLLKILLRLSNIRRLRQLLARPQSVLGNFKWASPH